MTYQIGVNIMVHKNPHIGRMGLGKYGYGLDLSPADEVYARKF